MNRQVPINIPYLIIGDGRLARHMACYFRLIGLTFSSWNRQNHSPSDLDSLYQNHDYALLCISDDAISDFANAHAKKNIQFIHFSGALEIENAWGFHPLMTFDQGNYDLKTYMSMHFVGSESEAKFNQVFPTLSNPYWNIPQDQKALYHSLCVTSGNGTTLLWQLVAEHFEKMGIGKKALIPYLTQVTKNISEESPGRFTGPWYRGDQTTIHQHQDVLEHTNLSSLYQQMTKQALELAPMAIGTDQ